MTKPGCMGYALSHQLLYFLFAKMKGWSDGLFPKSKHYVDILCANMTELNLETEESYDSFHLLSSVMFCGLSGYSDFYKARWLQAILTWQRPVEGCFGKPCERQDTLVKIHIKEFHLIFLFIFLSPDDNRKQLSRVSEDEQQSLRRVKRREKGFADGCSSHKTAVAVAVLGGFLYYSAVHSPTITKTH
ncbi:UPF0764 protein C16orf89 homolog [Monodelphis domestica]|uniref:UPF0764 protein C16orf89 homolog n=1 Tax=Monodelphis domestica TaxID=13616 RepID=UPI0024E26FF6|nr:UPF0764 protein C16orf89 homolog [Monodelphis domestica]